MLGGSRYLARTVKQPNRTVTIPTNRIDTDNIITNRVEKHRLDNPENIQIRNEQVSGSIGLLNSTMFKTSNQVRDINTRLNELKLKLDYIEVNYKAVYKTTF